MAQYDFEGLAGALLQQAEAILPEWFPNGKRVGNDWQIANFTGAAGQSLKINFNKGSWKDYETGESGGDLISLYARWKEIEQGESYKILSERYGHSPTNVPGPPPSTKKSENLKAPPPGTPAPHFNMGGKWGDAVAKWEYKDADGHTLFWIARYEAEGERKQYYPWCWDADRKRWVNRGWPAPRPVYGLHWLYEQDKLEKNVMICEGEKPSDAARKFVGNSYIVISWPGGVQAVDHINWKPLYGHKVTLWPDADLKTPRGLGMNESVAKKAGWGMDEILPAEEQPGRKAMLRIIHHLAGHCPEIKILEVGVSPLKKDGWDAADALDEGYDLQRFLNWGRPLLKTFTEKELSAIIETDRKGARVTKDRIPPEEESLWSGLRLDLTDKRTPRLSMDNVCRVLEYHPNCKGRFWKDDFHNKLFTTWRHDGQGSDRHEMSDVYIQWFTRFLQRDIRMGNIPDKAVKQAVLAVANDNRKNELVDWMNTLEWDGKERINNFWHDIFGTPDNIYYRAMGVNWWVSIVARAMNPGCKVDTMVILRGPQGLLKSMALNIIGGAFYVDANESIRSKDFFIVLQGKLIVEIAELDSFSKADTTRIKQVVSCQVDRYRTPYDTYAADHPRQCVFVGSTNKFQWSDDETGARRFWPVDCGKIDIPLVTELREQYFAEAKRKLEGNHRWWEMPVEETLAMQEGMRVSDIWEEAIGDYVLGRTTVDVKSLAAACLNLDISKIGRVEQNRIYKALRVLNFRTTVRKDKRGNSVRAWVRELDDVPARERGLVVRIEEQDKEMEADRELGF